MPRPMKPLNGLSRYTSSFVGVGHQGQQHNVRGGTTLDDSAVDLMHRFRNPMNQIQPFHTLSSQTSSGGTLPRPKGLVKPMPVAPKISSSREDVDACDQYKSCVNGQAMNNPQMSGNRNAGDVLNDIGSMLADLTEELDSMLKTEQRIFPTQHPS